MLALISLFAYWTSPFRSATSNLKPPWLWLAPTQLSISLLLNQILQQTSLQVQWVFFFSSLHRKFESVPSSMSALVPQSHHHLSLLTWNTIVPPNWFPWVHSCISSPCSTSLKYSSVVPHCSLGKIQTPHHGLQLPSHGLTHTFFPASLLPLPGRWQHSYLTNFVSQTLAHTASSAWNIFLSTSSLGKLFIFWASAYTTSFLKASLGWRFLFWVPTIPGFSLSQT